MGMGMGVGVFPQQVMFRRALCYGISARIP
jgi:hypothetical protein